MKVILGTDPIKYPLTGIGRYTYELAKALQSYESSELSELLFLQGRHISRDIPAASETAPRNTGLKRMVQRSRLASELYRLTAPWLKTRALKPYPQHIYHGPNFYLPPGVDNCVATFHDLSVFSFPECHPAERVRFMHKELSLTLRRAKVLITDSEFTRRELAQYFNYPLAKIVTARLASSGEFYPRDGQQINQALLPFGLSAGQYSLFTGSIEPRKNLKTLLDAYQQLPVSLRQRYPLVICGFKGWGSESLHARFEQAEKEGWLRYLGFARADDLPWLFAGARAFIFPSLYEGFGLPVLEAMSSGVPVVCSNSSSLPEVVGDCALMHDPLDADGFTTSIRQSLEDALWREAAISAGLERAKLFSWRRCAQETINAYNQV
ncbi:glycosyltransferase family 4 protein [Sodalis sp. RH21]|uniref:glycosyltransferase family 4 protein n=1 Tax=unclassified Sodalis (in: enterobacteria) TaxID=2636512 RepID=UPI0039B3D663